MSLLRRALGGVERRGMPFLTNYGDGYYGDPTYYGDGAIPPNSWIPTTSSGAAVTEQTSLQLSIFFACVRLLADSIAALPWEVYRTTGTTRTKVIDPEPQIIRQPWPEVSTFDWKHMLVVSMAMRGNAYGYVAERDRLGYPTSILPLHPDWVVINRDPKTGERICWINGQREPYQDLFHIKWFTLPGFDIALSPLQIFRQSIGLGLAAEDFGGRWFRDGAAPSSTLETDQVLTPEQIQQTQKQWVASQGGKRLPAVLSGGFKWKPVTITPEESQFLQTRHFQVAEIARVFGIPPHMVGDVDRSTSWGTGIEQMSVGFVTYTLGPWISRIESAFNGILPRGQQMKFSVEGLLRGDIAARYSAYQMGLDSGFLNPDEVRAKEDLEPIPGGKGKLFRQPLNFGPLGYDPTQHPAPNPSGTNLPVQKAPSSKQPTSKQPASTPKSGTSA